MSDEINNSTMEEAAEPIPTAPALTPNGYRYSSVVNDTGEYVDFVLVTLFLDADGQEVRQVESYTPQEGESLVDTLPPAMRPYAGAAGFVRPVWDDAGSAWAEAATADELSAWELEHPSPVPSEAGVRAQRDKLLAETDWTQVADAPIDDETKKAFRVYRQALRDITEQEGFPADVAWPEMPVVVKAEPEPIDEVVDVLLGGAE